MNGKVEQFEDLKTNNEGRGSSVPESSILITQSSVFIAQAFLITQSYAPW